MYIPCWTMVSCARFILGGRDCDCWIITFSNKHITIIHIYIYVFMDSYCSWSTVDVQFFTDTISIFKKSTNWNESISHSNRSLTTFTRQIWILIFNERRYIVYSVLTVAVYSIPMPGDMIVIVAIWNNVINIFLPSSSIGDNDKGNHILLYW